MTAAKRPRRIVPKVAQSLADMRKSLRTAEGYIEHQGAQIRDMSQRQESMQRTLDAAIERHDALSKFAIETTRRLVREKEQLLVYMGLRHIESLPADQMEIGLRDEIRAHRILRAAADPKLQSDVASLEQIAHQAGLSDGAP